MGNIFCMIKYNKTLNFKTSFIKIKNGYFIFDAPKEQKSEFNDIIILFDGEIYNLYALQKELQTCSFNKLLIIYQAYQKWGIKAFNKIDGVYSCLLYDKKENVLYAFRDRVGVKSLYYYLGRDFTLFSNQLRSFYQIDSFKKEIDQNSLALYLQFGYILQPYTIYKNTFKLKSGHFLKIDLKDKKVNEYKYWDIVDLYNRKKLDIDEVEAINKAEELLEKAILKRVNAIANYGAFLSGGYDSSTVAYFLQKSKIEKIKTFTIGFEDSSINEAPYAKEVAKFLSLDHVEYYFSINDAIRVIPKLSDIYDEPFADAGAVPSSLLGFLAKESGIKILFGGDGGDEVFATADNLENFTKFLKIPQTLKNSIYYMMSILPIEEIPFIKESYLIKRKYLKLKKILPLKTISSMIKIKTSLFYYDEIKEILNSDFSFYKSAFDEDNFKKHSECVDRIIGTYFKTFMSDGELIKSTQALNYYDIILKKPYLDLDLIDFLSQIPASLKVKNGIKKYILKQIIHKYIPKELLNRPKKGFSIPLIFWFENGLREFLLDILSEDSIKRDQIFNHVEIKNLKYQFFSTKNTSKRKYEFARKLWFILLFKLWYNHHIKEL